MLDWRKYIQSDPSVLLGKPTVKGTRLAVEFILELFANGWTEEQILDNYPTLTREGLKSVFAFASECLKDEALFCFSSERDISNQKDEQGV